MGADLIRASMASLVATRPPTKQKPNSDADRQREQDGLDGATLYAPGRIVNEIFHRITPVLDCVLRRFYTILDTIRDIGCKLRGFVDSLSNIARLVYEGLRHFVYN
jgi:hypothetical protein